MAKVFITLKDNERDGVEGVDVAMTFEESADADDPTTAEKLAIYLIEKINEITKEMEVIGSPYEPLNKDPDPTLN